MLNIPMPFMPKVPCRPGIPPPRVPEALQWPMSLLLEKFTKYRKELVEEVAGVVGKAQVKSVNGRIGDVALAASDVGLGNVANTGDSAVPVAGGTTKFTTGGAYAELAKKVSVADLFDNPATAPTVKSSLLPSYVDDVLEYASLAAFPAAGETGKIYVAKDTNKTYRWSGSQYTEIAKSVSVVAPSTDPADAGKAADAKATGDALAGKLSRAEAEAGFTEWDFTHAPLLITDNPELKWNVEQGAWKLYLNGEYQTSFPGSIDDVRTNFGGGEYATRTRLPTMADIPTKTSDLTNDSGYLTQHQQLTPVYSQTPTFSEWVCTPSEANGVAVLIVEEEGGTWRPSREDGAGGGELKGDALSTTITWSIYEWWGGYLGGGDLTATRTRTDIVGYTLGDQTTKPLQPQGEYAPATGIAKAALAPDVQTSLGKADTAVQPAALAGYATTAQLVQKADVSALRYDLPAGSPVISSASSEVVEGETVTYGEVALADRTANRVAIVVEIAELRLTFPAVVSGKVRDFGLRVEVGDGTAALTAPALVPPAGVTLENADGGIPALADGAADAKGKTILYFSETSPGVFLVKGEEAKEVA